MAAVFREFSSRHLTCTETTFDDHRHCYAGPLRMDGGVHVEDETYHQTLEDLTVTDAHGLPSEWSSATITRTKEQHLDLCSICLEPITERAVAVSCNHLSFDFVCLASWLQEQATCPLCKAAVTAVQYDWRSPDDYKTFRLSPRLAAIQGGLSRQARSRRPVERGAPGSGTALTLQVDPAIEQRRLVYRDRTYSLHVGTNPYSGYRNFTPHSFQTSPVLQSQARAFLRRELKVFTFLDAQAMSRDYLTEFLIAVLKTNEIKGAEGKAEDLAAEFLGRDNARLLLHELENWLQSPLARLDEWDCVVQYDQRRQQDKG